MLTISSCSGAEAHECQIENVKRTFIQLWDDDSQRPAKEWEKQFVELNDIGFSEVILQWTSYGWIDQPTASFADDSYTEIFLPNIIKAAKKQKIRLWIGLHYDPSWWERIEIDDQLAKEYLDNRLDKLSYRIKKLKKIIEANDTQGDTIAGWYISDEIDDINWNTQHRFNLISSYLLAISNKLNQGNLKLPIMISAFSNGNLSPIILSKFLTKLIKQNNIDILLFQDGIGVEKLSLQQLKQYLPPLSFNVKKASKSLGLIVELFSKTPKNNFTTSSYSRITSQISIEKPWGTEPLTVFSAFDNLLENNSQATTLLKHWQQEYLKCVSHEEN